MVKRKLDRKQLAKLHAMQRDNITPKQNSDWHKQSADMNYRIHKDNMEHDNSLHHQNLIGMKPFSVSGDTGENLPTGYTKNPTLQRPNKHHRNPTEKHEWKSILGGKPQQLGSGVQDIMYNANKREKYISGNGNHSFLNKTIKPKPKGNAYTRF